MAAVGRPPTFEGAVANGSTIYVGVKVRDGRLGGQIAWTDATSSATITLELTSFGAVDAPVDGAASYKWKDSGLTITGPSASAAGATLVNVDNVQQRRGRYKIVAAAASNFIIHDGADE